MQTKVLIVAIVQNKHGEILLRKKPNGSPPYTETWYIFGAELHPGVLLEDSLVAHIQRQAGVTVRMTSQVSWDTEVKHDLDGVEKQFVYLDAICEHVGGELTLSDGVEKLEWVPKDKLCEYDNVPPSVTLFQKLGWM